MSNRSMLEINHDYWPDDAHLLEWAKGLQRYLNSGDPTCLPYGVTWFGMRHHSAPCPMGRPPRGWDNDQDRPRCWVCNEAINARDDDAEVVYPVRRAQSEDSWLTPTGWPRQSSA